jgi:tetratricopeptide (TPR) repeat protein
MHGLGKAYRTAVQIDAAIQPLEQVVAARRKMLGELHPDTLASMTELGIVYQEAGRYDQAVSLLQHVVAVERRETGSAHPTTLYAMNVLAEGFRYQGQFDESIRLHEERLAAARKTFGDDHPNTSISVVNIGNTIADYAAMYRRTGQAREADQLLESAIAENLARGRFSTAFIAARSSGNVEKLDAFIREAIHGNDALASTGLDALILGELRIVAGEFDLAIRAINAAIARGTQPYFAYKSLGWALLASGKSEEAKKAFEQALFACRDGDGAFQFQGANHDELTAAYFLDLITQEEYIERLKNDNWLDCFPWFYIGQRREIERDQNAAIAAYRRCVELGKNSTFSLNNLARWRLKELATTPEAQPTEPD